MNNDKKIVTLVSQKQSKPQIVKKSNGSRITGESWIPVPNWITFRGLGRDEACGYYSHTFMIDASPDKIVIRLK
jgi:hypothetical protein